MRHQLSLFTLSLALCILLGSCSKHEQIIIEPNKNGGNDDDNKATRMFIGVHTRNVNYPTVFDLIVGFTNSDSSFTQTDSIRGPFMISSNNDKHSSALSLAKGELYFLFKHAINGTLQLGIVNTIDGKFKGSHDMGIIQDDMIHLQYNEKESKLYFSMGQNLYLLNETNGSRISLKNQDAVLELPNGYGAGDNYLSHLISSKKFMSIRNNASVLIYDRTTKVWDSIGLNDSGSYRSLIVDPNDENTLFSYDLVGNTNYHLVKIDLKNKAATNLVSQNSFCHILWFQARYCSHYHLYTCLPFDHFLFPYFIAINVNTGETIYYPTPSVLGHCILI